MKQISVLRHGFDHFQISHMLTGALCVDHASLHDANAGVRTGFIGREVIVRHLQYSAEVESKA